MTETGHRAPWDNKNVKALERLRKEGLSVAVISERLGMSEKGVLSKLKRLRQAAAPQAGKTES